MGEAPLNTDSISGRSRPHTTIMKPIKIEIPTLIACSWEGMPWSLIRKKLKEYGFSRPIGGSITKSEEHESGTLFSIAYWPTFKDILFKEFRADWEPEWKVRQRILRRRF